MRRAFNHHAVLAVGIAALLLSGASVLAHAQAMPVSPVGVGGGTDTVQRRRPKAIEVSDAYATRLRIHRYAAYTMIPLFIVQSVAGNQLLKADDGGAPRPAWASATHSAGAAGLGVLFTVNTVTGVWNAWDSRAVDEGRGRRLLHSGLMLLSDAGFTYAGIKLSDDAKHSRAGRQDHLRLAYLSMGTALAGYGVMLFGNH